MSEEELRQYCKDASNEIIKLGEENTQLKSVLKEIRELLGHFECGQVCECTQELAIHVLEIINKVIGEDK